MVASRLHLRGLSIQHPTSLLSKTVSEESLPPKTKMFRTNTGHFGKGLSEAKVNFQPNRGTDQAPEGRYEIARGASPGKTEIKEGRAPEGRQTVPHVCSARSTRYFLSPLRGLNLL